MSEINREGYGIVDKPHLQRFKNNLDLILDHKVNDTDYATVEKHGIVKPDGTSITIDENGVISGSSAYQLPTASTDVLGGVKIDGRTIVIQDGVISSNGSGNIDYSLFEQDTGVKYINGSEIYQISYYFFTPIECVELEWNEVIEPPLDATTLIDCRIVEPDGAVSCPRCNIDNGYVKIYPMFECEVKMMTIQYVKLGVPIFMNDITWEEASEYAWSDFENTQWKFEI